jgi:hypothetical protein
LFNAIQNPAAMAAGAALATSGQIKPLHACAL